MCEVSWTDVLVPQCGHKFWNVVELLSLFMKSQKHSSRHRNPHFKHMTRVVGTGCDVGYVAPEKQGRYLWKEHIFVVCLSIKRCAFTLWDGVTACNLWSIDLLVSDTWMTPHGRNSHVATRNKMCLHDWN